MDDPFANYSPESMKLWFEGMTTNPPPERMIDGKRYRLVSRDGELSTSFNFVSARYEPID